MEAEPVQGGPEGFQLLRAAHNRHYALLIAPAHMRFVIRLTGYLTGLLEGVRKPKSGPGDVNPTTGVDLSS